MGWNQDDRAGVQSGACDDFAQSTIETSHKEIDHGLLWQQHWLKL